MTDDGGPRYASTGAVVSALVTAGVLGLVWLVASRSALAAAGVAGFWVVVAVGLLVRVRRSPVRPPVRDPQEPPG